LPEATLAYAAAKAALSNYSMRLEPAPKGTHKKVCRSKHRFNFEIKTAAHP